MRIKLSGASMGLHTPRREVDFSYPGTALEERAPLCKLIRLALDLLAYIPSEDKQKYILNGFTISQSESPFVTSNLSWLLIHVNEDYS